MDTLSAIVHYGLSIRQIPVQTVSLFSVDRDAEGPDIVLHEIDGKNFDPFYRNRKDSTAFIFDVPNRRIFRKFRREVKIPANAGWWMVKQVGNTSSRVEWNKQNDNLAPTLEEAVSKFLESLHATRHTQKS